MENQGVVCDVCACVYHKEENKCGLPRIHVTEECAQDTQAVETPHFCKSFEEK